MSPQPDPSSENPRPTTAETVVHPVRLRVLQAVGGRRVTTAQLREALPDIAQATLYRHVRALVDGGFLEVVEERPVRGAVERTYAIGERLAHVDQTEMAAMSTEQLRAAFQAHLNELARTFDQAIGSDAGREMLGFGNTVLYVDLDDMKALQEGFAELITQYTRADTADAEHKQRVILSTAVLLNP